MNHMTLDLPAQPALSYPIRVGVDLLTDPSSWLSETYNTHRIVIITDDTVKSLYGEHLYQQLNRFEPLLLSFPPGEPSKNYQTKHLLENQMIQHYCSRDTLILALGGGVVGDLGGFIASTYLRGIPYIQIPTTLLAMVDSSVGGKTGINTHHGKNLIGSFWQPKGVIVDLNCLKSLSQHHLINGLIEALKIFITSDLNYFNVVKNHLPEILKTNLVTLKELVHRAIKIKIDIVARDEKENNQRMILNFGHTIGHALEKIFDYTLLHGYAVALGILVEAKMASLLGHLSQNDYWDIKECFLKLNISGQQLQSIDSDKIIHATQSDKKIQANKVRYVLLNKIGTVYTDDTHYAFPVSDDIVKQAISEVIDGR